MKAAIVKAYGSKIEVTDIAQPVLLADSLMIEVHATSVNPVDNLIRAGYTEVFFMWPSGAQLAQIGKLVEQGIIKPLIDKTFSLDQAQEAFDYSQSGRAKGKIVVAIR